MKIKDFITTKIAELEATGLYRARGVELLEVENATLIKGEVSATPIPLETVQEREGELIPNVDLFYCQSEVETCRITIDVTPITDPVEFISKIYYLKYNE